MSDNRRRIRDDILEEVEGFDGRDFTEKLLKWKAQKDTVSVDIDEIREVVKSQLQENLSRQALDRK